jgi:hypothetical protein
MIRMGKASGLAAGVMAIAVAACGGSVDVQGVGSTAASSSATSTTSTSTSTGGGMGGTGGVGGGMLPPPACAPGEGAIVAAMYSNDTMIAIDDAGTWNFEAFTVPKMPFVTYVDGYQHLGVLWFDGTATPEQAHFAVTDDGQSFETYDVHQWSPSISGGPMEAVANDVLFGRDSAPSALARFDEDQYDWIPYPGGAVPLAGASSAAPLSGGEFLIVGLGPQTQLCDVTLGSAGWGSLHCRDDVPVATGGEIPVTRPQAVTLPNGDMVVVYYQAAGATLAATTLHQGVWSTPEPITSSVISISFVLTATPQGDVIVALPAESGGVNALRYTPGVGWGKPIPLISGGSAWEVAAAPGICGDDALIALGCESSEGNVMVARLRGDAVELDEVGAVPDDRVYQISLATRP